MRCAALHVHGHKQEVANKKTDVRKSNTEPALCSLFSIRFFLQHSGFVVAVEFVPSSFRADLHSVQR
jgi:hypothetical protein